MTNDVKPGSTIVVWFSCGAASAVAAHETLRRFPDCTVRVVNNPVAEEDEDNRRFARDVSEWIGIEIEEATNSKWETNSCVDVWKSRRFMSSKDGAPCTLELKKRARQQWESENHHDFMVMGFTADEEHRHKKFKRQERDNILPVLIDAGLTKADCFRIVQAAGLVLPRIYEMGYPNANCIGCVKATSPTYWNHVRKTHPQVFEQRSKQSRDIGCRLTRVNNKRIFLDELDKNATGLPLKSIKNECGLFCDT